MDKKEGAGRNYPESCQTCKRWKEVKERLRLIALLESVIEKMQEALKDKSFKPTIGDYIKLVQMEKEIEETADQSKEIKVTWVEPADTENGE